MKERTCPPFSCTLPCPHSTWQLCGMIFCPQTPPTAPLCLCLPVGAHLPETPVPLLLLRSSYSSFKDPFNLTLNCPSISPEMKSSDELIICSPDFSEHVCNATTELGLYYGYFHICLSLMGEISRVET